MDLYKTLDGCVHEILQNMVFCIPAFVEVILSVLSIQNLPLFSIIGKLFSLNSFRSEENFSKRHPAEKMDLFFELITIQIASAHLMDSVISNFQQRKELALYISIKTLVEDAEHWLVDCDKKEGFILALKNYINHIMIKPLSVAQLKRSFFGMKHVITCYQDDLKQLDTNDLALVEQGGFTFIKPTVNMKALLKRLQLWTSEIGVCTQQAFIESLEFPPSVLATTPYLQNLWPSIRQQLENRTEKSAGRVALRVDALIAYVAQISKISKKRSVLLNDLMVDLHVQQDLLSIMADEDDCFELPEVLQFALPGVKTWQNTLRVLEDITSDRKHISLRNTPRYWHTFANSLLTWYKSEYQGTLVPHNSDTQAIELSMYDHQST